ncbi:hypothetical protein SAMN04489835_2504 [Mycolicibacterium rutilum]|uniref:Uncharacterized protein n=1 Tax=Mycolicibacterium rutilum TaxID=370526 RepID=A0A1H6JWM2_MYCRU|nr:hypothetical protein [Mycolicibacterium rutilum]SEH65412.1 hypothetical protein SAMN04489835_2504 [Mycolicibacterium rutilum]
MSPSTRQADRNLIDRYQDFRTRRFLKHERTYANSLPRWRTQRRRRMLVVVMAATLAVMLCVSVVCAFGFRQAALIWLPATLIFFPTFLVLQIVSGRQGDAPQGVLDEYEIQQRNSARSIGLTVTQNLMLVPILYLIVLSVNMRTADADAVRDMAYAGGLMALAVLLIGGCLPVMILGWSRPDPDA